jgi:hypothetical protein
MSDQDKLALIPSQSIDLEIYQNKTVALETLEKLSTYFIDSKLYGVGDQKALVAQAIVKMMAGKDLGISPFLAMKEIYIIPSNNGNRFMYSANLVARLVKQSKIYNYKIVKLTNQECSIDFYENGQLEGNSMFTMQDAIDAGLATNPTYKKFPRNMLRNRAITNGAMWFCPLLGLGTIDGIAEENEPNQKGFIDLQIEQSKQSEEKENLLTAIQNITSMGFELSDVLFTQNEEFSQCSIEQLKQLVQTRSSKVRDLLIVRLKQIDSNVNTTSLDLPDLYLLYNKSVIRISSN